MWAIVTGASSGIGYDISKELCKRGYDLIIIGRRQNRLEALKTELDCNTEIFCGDLTDADVCRKVYEDYKNFDIEVLINNAGFGAFGEFSDLELNRELDMIDTNIRAVHILTKLFLKDFVARDRGYILNVASSAAFFPGPLLATYYATKSYVFRLTEGIHEELRRRKSNVYIGTLCPGPVRTEFDEVANVKFSLNGLSSDYVAKYTVKKMFKRKMLIIPGFVMKTSKFFSRFASEKMLMRIAFNMQKKKR